MGYSQPKILTFRAGGTIARGKAVKFGSADDTVVVGAGATDDCIGIAQNAAESGDFVEVALPGGGGLALSQTTVTRGMLMVSHTDGALKPIAAANDRVVAMAMASGSANDLIPVEVLACQATATE